MTAVYQSVSRSLIDTPLSLPQHVARPAHRMDQARLAVSLELLPQVADIDLDQVRLAAEVVVPDPIEDHLARQYPARVVQEERQQLVLLGRQLDPTLTAERLAGGG